MAAITISSVLCAFGAIYGMFVLIKHLKIVRRDVSTKIIYAFPIFCGTLAWASASYTFYTTGADSYVDVPRVLMLISWCMLASQHRQRYKRCNRRKRKRG